jgi:hypothetical protein
MAALVEHVGGVLLVGAEEQVRRIAAGTVVAAMADEQPVWNRPHADDVGEAVGIDPGRAPASGADLPVTARG